MSDSPENLAEQPTRLNEIATNWSLLRLAHQNSLTHSGPARNALVLRYSGAIRKFIGLLVPVEQDADDVAQEMVVRLLRGDFAQAAPDRGRFRDYLAVAARNLVRSYWARKGAHAAGGYDIEQLPARAAAAWPADEEFLATWRRSVLEKTWSALEEYQRSYRGSVAWTVLRLRSDYPDEDSDQLARRLSEATDRPFRPEAMRQQLRRARLRFAQLLLEEIAQSLQDPTPARVEEELIEVGLMDYVRDFLPPDWRARGELAEE